MYVVTVLDIYIVTHRRPVASFTKEVNPRLAKRSLKTNGLLCNRQLTSLVKEAAEIISLSVA